jgi:hypothetical protein
VPQPIKESATQPISIQGRLSYRGVSKRHVYDDQRKASQRQPRRLFVGYFERGMQSTLSLHAKLTYTDNPQLPLR